MLSHNPESRRMQGSRNAAGVRDAGRSLGWSGGEAAWMWLIVIGVVCCYAAAAAALHWYMGRRIKSGDNGRRRKHYVLFAADQERNMERILRSIRWYAARTGTDVRVTVVDEGSRDDTMRIAACFTRNGQDAIRLAAIRGGKEARAARSFGVEAVGSAYGENEGIEVGAETKAKMTLTEGKRGDCAAYWAGLPHGTGRIGQSGSGGEAPILVDLGNPADWERLP